MGIFIAGFVFGVILWLWGTAADKQERARRERELEERFAKRPPIRARTIDEIMKGVKYP